MLKTFAKVVGAGLAVAGSFVAGFVLPIGVIVTATMKDGKMRLSDSGGLVVVDENKYDVVEKRRDLN